MKKNYFIILFLLSVNYIANSQNDIPVFGIKAGSNFSQYTPDFKVDNTSLQSEFTPKFGYYFGGFANLRIKDNLRLQTELLFTNNGTKVKYDVTVAVPGSFNAGTFVSGEYEYNLNEFNVSVPISLQYQFSNKFFIEAGFMFNYVLFAKQRIINYPLENAEENLFDNPEENLDRFDLAGLLGLGFKFSKDINFNLRYSLSILERNSSAFHNDNIVNPDFIPIDYVRTSIFYLGLEYKLPIKISQ